MSKIFGYRLKKLRTQKNMLQKELAQVLGTTVPTISAWELNRQEPSMSMLGKMKDFFKVSTDYLMGYDVATKQAIYWHRKSLIIETIKSNPKIMQDTDYDIWANFNSKDAQKFVNRFLNSDGKITNFEELKEVLDRAANFEDKIIPETEEIREKYYDIECQETENANDIMFAQIQKAQETEK